MHRLVLLVILVPSLLGAAGASSTARADEAAPAVAPIPVPDPAPAPAGRPLTLADALRAAQDSSRAVATADATAARARMDGDTARASRLPQVAGSVGYTRQLLSEFDGIDFGGGSLPFGQASTWRIGVSVTQGIWDGGRVKAALALADASAKLSGLAVGTARTQVVLTAALAYFDVALAEQQVAIATAALAQAEATLADAQLAFSHDSIAEFDVLRAEVARDNQRETVRQYRLQLDVAQVALRHAIGAPLDEALTLATVLDDAAPDAVLGDVRAAAGLPAGARSAQVVSAEAAIDARHAAIKAIDVEKMPTVSAATDLGLVDYAEQPFNGDWRANWTIGVSLSVPIFDGFRRRAQLRAARADLAIATIQRDDAARSEELARASADLAVDSATTTLASSARTVAQAKRAYEIAELRYEQGTSTHLELVDSRLAYEQAQLMRARAAHDVRAAMVRRELLPGLPAQAR